MAEKLTPKEELFVVEYLVDKNGSRAAREAGYAERVAKQTAYVLLRKPHIKAAIKRALLEQQKRTLITADQVLRDIDRIAAKAEGAGEYHAALKGKELLGKHYRLFSEKVELSGVNDGPIEFTRIERTIVDPVAKDA